MYPARVKHNVDTKARRIQQTSPTRTEPYAVEYEDEQKQKAQAGG